MGGCCQCSGSSAASPPAGEAARRRSLEPLRLGVAIFLAGLAMTFSLALNLDPPEGLTRAAAHALLAVITAGGMVLLGAPLVKRAFASRLTLEHLFLLGIVGTYAASVYSSLTGVGDIYYEVVLILLAIYTFGQVILARQTERARRLATAIPGLRETARVIVGDSLVVRPLAQVNCGDRLEVREGEWLPIDGIVRGGAAYVEQQAHTGETMPVVVRPGDPVLAGSRLLDGTLEIEATARGTERELDRIVEACTRSLEAPSSIESLAQRVLNVFFPVVVAVTLGTLLGWWLAGDLREGWFSALAVTVVACPCALGLAIPLGARRGLLDLRLCGIRAVRPDFMDRLASVDTVVFDKTGTLTHPILRLAALDIEPDGPPELERWLAVIQRRSTHPVARPFWNLSGDPGDDLDDLRVEALPGLGVRAGFRDGSEKHEVLLGNRFLARRQGLGLEGSDDRGRVLYAFADGRFAARAVLEESSRETTEATLRALAGAGYGLSLLTGDTSCPPEYRRYLEVRLGVSAREKARWIERIESRGRRVLYIGDGMNDCESLAAATAGIALESGQPAAPGAGHALLVHDDLSILPGALGIARGLRKRLEGILAFSLSYNAGGMALAAGGLLHPVVAALLMLGSSVTVLTLILRTERTSAGSGAGATPDAPRLPRHSTGHADDDAHGQHGEGGERFA